MGHEEFLVEDGILTIPFLEHALTATQPQPQQGSTR